MKVRLISAICLIFGLYLIVSFSRDLWNLVKKEGEIQEANLRLGKLKVKNEQLEKQLQLVESPGFVEKEAREKLGLTKEGETVLILPENIEEKDGNSQSYTLGEQKIPNWQKWRRLFFGS